MMISTRGLYWVRERDTDSGLVFISVVRLISTLVPALCGVSI